jgi:hypothetical protein
MYRNIATNRGQWIREKWYIKNKKGYLKIHIVVVNVKTKKILSMKVTTDDEHVHDDSKALPWLVNNAMESDKKIIIGKLIADDGAYDGNNIFRYLFIDNGYALYQSKKEC